MELELAAKSGDGGGRGGGGIRGRFKKRKVVRLLNANAYVEYVRRAKKLPYMNNLLRQIAALHLEQYSNDNDRALAFMRYMYLRRVKWSTFKKYFYKLRPLFWPESTVKASPMLFDLHNPPQNREPNPENLHEMVRELKSMVRTDRHTHPILVAYYTGLRTVEVCRLHVSHLSMLVQRKSVIPLKRKIGTEWKVYYFEKFEELISTLAEYYREQLIAYTRYGIDTKLFDQSTSTINYHLRRYYTLVCKSAPHPGFGLHVFRYNLATVVENREVARMILDHKDPLTTDRYYIKLNHPKLQSQLEIGIEADPLYSKIAERNDESITGRVDPSSVVVA